MINLKTIDPVHAIGLDPVRLHVPLAAVRELAVQPTAPAPLSALLSEIDRRTAAPDREERR